MSRGSVIIISRGKTLTEKTELERAAFAKKEGGTISKLEIRYHLLLMERCRSQGVNEGPHHETG